MSGVVVEPARLQLADIVDTASRFVTTEYASLTASGRPVTWPVTPYRGDRGTTVDVSTGVTYPLKAERARRDRRVALSFSYPAGSGLDPAPTIVVQGLATVRDADLAATSGRYLRLSAERFPEAMGKVPTWMMKRMAWYWTRMWIEVTPIQVLWWDEGDLGREPRRWHAPSDVEVPPSDPAHPGASAGSWAPAPDDWRPRAAGVIERLGQPVLTTVDATGHPLPVRMRRARADGDGFVAVAPVGVDVVDGPCALSFHTHRAEFDGQENVGLVGTCSVIDREADGACVVRVHVERALADWGVPRNPLRSALSMAAAGRRLRPRLAAEAERRGTPLPTFDQLER